MKFLTYLFFACCILFIIGLVSFLLFQYLPAKKLLELESNSVTPLAPVMNLQQPYIVYGYLPYWTRNTATLRSEVTHVSYFSLEIQGDGNLLSIPKANQDAGFRAWHNGALADLKPKLEPHQKLELTLTMMDQDAIPLFVASPSAHFKLLSEIETILLQNPVDGINIDIEYNGEVTPQLQEQLVDVVRKIDELLAKQPTQKNLSIAVYADAATTQRITSPKLVAPYVDHVIIMAYDFHRRSSPRSGPVAPLFGGSEKKWESDIVQTLKAYTSLVPAQKIILGIPFYGYEWSVTSTDPQSFTLPKSGSTATYQRVQELISSGRGTVKWDELALSPYLQYVEDGQQQLIYFEDAKSLSYKLDLVKQSGLGGIAIWALGYEGDTQELWSTIREKLR